MINTLDQTGDVNGQQLYRLSKLYPLPPFVKKASSSDIYGDDELETHQYADVTYRRYPCHTAASTYISTLFFLDKRADFHADEARLIESRLNDFAYIHGTTERMTDLKNKVASANKVNDTINEDDFGLIIPGSSTTSGKTEYYYPLRNAIEVKKAAENLQKYRDVIPYHDRQSIAVKLLDKAFEYGAGLGDLDDFVHKQAGHGAAASIDVAQLLFDRARLLKRAGKMDHAVEVARLAKVVAADPDTIQDNDRLVKLASLIDEVDHTTGLNNFVDDLVKPEDVFFNITEKIASKLREEHVATTSGNIYKLADIDQLKLNDVRDLMGADFADAISTGGLFVSPEKIADIVPTLPRSDAELFDRLLNSVGISPVAKEAAHNAVKLAAEDLTALAELHKASSW